MQYIIFSDIHGNAEVLKRLIETEKEEDDRTFIFCGDICGYYYQAKKCVQLLKDMNRLIAVRGNHDQYYLDAYENAELTEQLSMRYGSSYWKKEKEVYSFIKGMPLRRKIAFAKGTLYIQHGTWSDPLEGRMYPDTEIEVRDENMVCISGHTHYQMLRSINGSLWMNPGSLGQPRDGKGFSYCIFNDEDMTVSFHTIEIGMESLIKEVRFHDPKNKYLEEILYRK